MSANMPGSLVRWMDGATDKRKAEVAGLILSEVDPSLENLAAFWAELGGEVRGELSAHVVGGGLSPE